MKHTVFYNGKTYVFYKQEEREPYEHFVNRCWWIVKNIDVSNDMNYLYHMSYIWSNVYYNNVSYNEQVMKELEKFCAYHTS